MHSFTPFFLAVQSLKKNKLPQITQHFRSALLQKTTLIALGIIIQVAINHSLAQKNNPVAGDAAQLVDFLKKDYSTISPEQREQQIMRDRAKVIGIFKSYLTLEQAEELGAEFVNKSKSLDEKSQLINSLINNLNENDSLKKYKIRYKLSDDPNLIKKDYLVPGITVLDIDKVDTVALYAKRTVWGDKLINLIIQTNEEIKTITSKDQYIDIECTCGLSIDSTKEIIEKLKNATRSYELSNEKMNAVKSMQVDPSTFNSAIGFIDAIHTSRSDLFYFQHIYDIDQLKKISCVMYGEEYINSSCMVDSTGFYGEYWNYRNRFLTDRIKAFIDKYEELQAGSIDHYAQAGRDVTLQKSTAFLGGDLAFETVIDGVSRFLAGRLKEELGVFAMDQVKKFMGKGDSIQAWEDVSVLFPSTSAFVTNMDSYTPDFLGKLNQYIQDDVDHLLLNLGKFKDLKRVKVLIEKYPTLAYTFEALEIIPQLSNISNPLDYFDIVANSSLIAEWSNPYGEATIAQYNIAQALKLSQMLAHSMTFMDGGKQQFINLTLANQYGSEEDFYKLYFGFLHQQNIKYYNIEFINGKGNPQPFDRILNEYMGNYFGIKQDVQDWMKKIGRIAELAHIVNDYASEIRRANKTDEGMDPIQISEFIGGLLDLGEEMAKVGQELIEDISNASYFYLDPGSQSFSIYDNTKPYWDMGRTSNDIFKNLIQKEYGMALIKSLELFCQLEPNLVKEELGELSEFVTILTDLERHYFWSTSFFETPRINEFLRIGSFKDLIHNSDSESEGNAFEGVLNEFYSIASYEWSHFNGHSARIMEDIIQLCLEEWPMGNANNGDEITKLEERCAKAIEKLKEPEFKQLYISYLLQLSTPLNDLKQSVINYFVEQGHFEESLVETFFRSFDELTDLYFERLVLLNERNSFNDLSEENQLRIMKLDSLIPQIAKKLLDEIEKVIVKRITENEKLDQNVVRVVHFFDEMARAENAEEIESAMKAFAMPSGSYAVKRNSKFNVSINAYPGLLPACEFARVLKSDSTGYEWNPAASFGFTAPIGLNFSWGLKKHGSLGLFVPVIDIGAATAFRFNANNDSVALLPKFTFANILAPGAYLSYGFRNAPISLNLGVQFGPQLRSIKVDQEQTLINSYRVGLGLTVDIPILNLHTRAYETKYADEIKTKEEKAEAKAEKNLSKVEKEAEKADDKRETEKRKEFDEYIKSGQKAFDDQKFDIAIDQWQLAAAIDNTEEIQAKIEVALDAKKRRNQSQNLPDEK